MIEYIAIIASATSLGVSITLAMCIQKELNNITSYRNELHDMQINLREGTRRWQRVELHFRRIIENFNELEEKVIGNEETEKPYSIYVTFPNPKNNRRICGVVNHAIEVDNVSNSFTSPDYVENKLLVYKKGDDSENPSARINIKDYVSIEVIKEDE